MFEKDIKEEAEKRCSKYFQENCYKENRWADTHDLVAMYLDGYNKAKEDADKMKSQFLELCNLKDMRIAELEKANEWHYVKDGICPTHSNGVLVLTDEGVGFGLYGLDDKKWHTYDAGFDVIAWKEIAPPKEIKP